MFFRSSTDQLFLVLSDKHCIVASSPLSDDVLDDDGSRAKDEIDKWVGSDSAVIADFEGKEQRC
jgi:hypothetical protein